MEAMRALKRRLAGVVYGLLQTVETTDTDCLAGAA
jgi:hypothetical protein